jgi:protocatechuate 3,4-dioxygenase beta subunit
MMPRRRVLEAVVASAAGLPLLRPAQATALAPTPAQTPGPFYPRSFPADAGFDLTHIAGRAKTAEGITALIGGQVLDTAGRPVSGARVEIWQCDANGRYHHLEDDRAGPPPDPGFQGCGRVLTDADGGYRFRTIRPVAYPGRTPHIHFAIAAGGRPRLVTQMYVAGEPLNERDGVLASIADPAARDRLIVPLRPAAERGMLAAAFDIVLG